MRFKKRSIVFDLSPTSIDRASEWFVEAQEEIGIEKHDRLRTRLLFEEALLNFAGRFGAEQEAEATIEKWAGRYRLSLAVVGPRFNPLRIDDDVQDMWTISLFSVIDLRTQYSYAVQSNVVRIPLPRKETNPVLRIILAIVGGIVFGALGNLLVPDAFQSVITSTILDPISEMWVRLLQAISGPIIFFTAMVATFGTKRISDFGGSRLKTVARYFGISALAVIFTMVCLIPFVSSSVAFSVAEDSDFSELLRGILNIVPGNLFEPFSTANTPQLLLIAIVGGYVLASMGSQANELKMLVQQVNLLGLNIARLACALVPCFVGLLLCLKIWTHEYTLLGYIWIPLGLSVAISAVVFLVVVITASLRLRVNPVLLVRKLKDPFLKALKTGSLDYSSVTELAGSCKSLLGIDKEFARAVLPQGLVLYMPTSAVGICVYVLFAANMQHIGIDLLWLLTAAFLSVVLAVATPPLNGANLLAFVVAFGYLGISNDAFLDVMVFDIVFGVFCIALDQALLEIETALQADSMGFLNGDVLRAPVKAG